MTLVYNGLLGRDQQHHIQNMADKYPHAVEVATAEFPWNRWHAWYKENLPKYRVVKEADMGGNYVSEESLYGIVWKDEKDKFFFFVTAKEKQMFVDEFRKYVIDAEPFKTVIK